MDDMQLLDRDMALSLLRVSYNPFVLAEEERHLWGSNHILAFGKPLLRTWDFWTPTPFISFTISNTAVQELANRRAENEYRGAQTVTAINPNIRIAKGLPVLDMKAEMEYYEVSDLYRKSSLYYKDHYLCLWEVTGDEIIGYWEWDDLATYDNWYEDVILPAFIDYNARAPFSPSDKGTFNMSSLRNELPETDVSGEEFLSRGGRSSSDLDDSIKDQNDRSDPDDDSEEHE
ncbi:hypothetical protein PISL3812_06925 [Talaromyces islandicus]|uniref:Uncharacterized protein n=1 Tax=Talaromyces islandicus TaxID=28573 RepID=A0A0U1M4C9_TALIS|nr:hypothetical protein PISL3812_06925 [Talaromyces islandicus]